MHRDPGSQHFELRDTFLDAQHFEECFTRNELIPAALRESVQYRPASLKKANSVRFTGPQVAAITSAMYEGLTVVVGPPGTGKTDLAVQLVNLLYHNFPLEKTLVITHSNHALNDIFAKIACLDIDEKHLLRLGIGAKELRLKREYSREGRINHMLERRL